MLWFKYPVESNEDPLLRELLDKFGARGPFIFLCIFSLFAKKYKPIDGWYLTIDFKFLAEETRRYKYKTLKKIIAYIENYQYDIKENYLFPEVNIEVIEKKININIPEIKRVMDIYTLRKFNRQENKPEKIDLNKFQNYSDTFQRITDDYNHLNRLISNNGSKKKIIIPGRSFIGKCLKENYPPEAIAECYRALVNQFEAKELDNNDNLFGYSLSIVKTISQRFDSFECNSFIWSDFKKYFKGF